MERTDLKNILSATALVLWTASRCLAEGYIETQDGILTDDDFYNVVVCGALPGKSCELQPAKWAASRALDLKIRLRLVGADDGLLDRTSSALDNAIANINSSGAALLLRRLHANSDESADVDIYVTSLQAGGIISGTVSEIDGTPIEGAAVNVSWNGNSEIERAVIVLAADLLDSELESIVLEELTQALGITNDIRNSHYEGVSILSEDSNVQTTLGVQDIMVLRRLYP